MKRCVSISEVRTGSDLPLDSRTAMPAADLSGTVCRRGCARGGILSAGAAVALRAFGRVPSKRERGLAANAAFTPELDFDAVCARAL